MNTSAKRQIVYSAIIVTAFFLLGTPISAQQNADRQALRKEMRTLMQDFAKTNIFPHLREWKRTLDQAMTAEDLRTLNELRKKAKDLRQTAKKHTESMRMAWEDEDFASLKNSRKQLRSLKDDRDELFDDLKPLAVKYKSTLMEIGKSAKPKVAEWKEQGKKLVEQFIEKNRGKLDEEAMEFLRKREERMPLLSEDTRKKLAVAKFMLWDGSEEMGSNAMPSSQGQSFGERASDAVLDQSYPNPTSGATTVHFTLAEPEDISLMIHTLSGEQIATIAQGRFPAGAHDVSFDVRELHVPEGAYFYTLNTNRSYKNLPLSISK